MTRIRRSRLDRPDVVRRFPHGGGALAEIGSLAIGRAWLEPGWRWSTDIKPTVGTPLCEVHHLHVLLAGRFAVELDDGERAELAAGDVFDVPPGHDAWVVGDEPVDIIDVSGNVVDFGLPSSHGAAVATILMTDIVNSTATADRIGDSAWRQLLADHNRVVRSQLARFGGREIDTTGDGFLASFGSAVSALHSARAIRDAVRELGLEVRVGVHTGEVDLRAGAILGLAVHAAARVMAAAGASQILVSGVTKALADGSGLHFESHGAHELKGFSTATELFELS